MNIEDLAIKYAEKYGIIDYKIEGNLMIYRERFYGEGIYEAKYNLVTQTEERKLVEVE